jgi:4-cresol dehydrogenase (hydroxylating)
MCGLEVVLPDGELIRTGFGAFPNAQATRVFQYGTGPWIDGLFTQSNIGIVTSMGIWLLRAPERCLGFAFALRDDSALGDVVEALRELKLSDVVRSTVHIANDLRVVSGRRRYPWELTGGATPLPDAVRSRLRAETGIGAWNVLGGLYGPGELVNAARRLVRRAFRPWARVVFFGERKLRLAATCARALRRVGGVISPVSTRLQTLGEQLDAKVIAIDRAYALLRGIPVADHLHGAAWRSRLPLNGADSLPADCGLIWCSPVLPMTRSACDEVLSVISTILERRAFEPLVTLSSINPRALCCVASLCFNRADAEECARAGVCHAELSSTLAAAGYFPYRRSNVGRPSADVLATIIRTNGQVT